MKKFFGGPIPNEVRRGLSAFARLLMTDRDGSPSQPSEYHTPSIYSPLVGNTSFHLGAT
jgi:hypothetical protein